MSPPHSPDLPEAFRKRMDHLLGKEAPAFLRALERPPEAGLRVNILKISPDAFARLTGWPLRPVPWCPSGFVLEDEGTGSVEEGPNRGGRHPYHLAGLFYLQDPSAMAVVEALAPEPGELILDLAAAPGGKSTHIASRLGGRGTLVANDLDRGRTRALAGNLERWGVRNAIVLSATPDLLARRWPGRFDRVLLDAPCSGEGMFRKSNEARAMWSERSVLGCARRQQGLIDQAATLVRPGGRLAYSTCTFAPEENEGVIAAFLDRRPDFRPVALDLPGTAPGRPDWLEGDAAGAGLAGAVRLWPHRGPGEGHFVAVLERDADAPLGSARGPRTLPVPGAHREAWRTFLATTLKDDPAGGLDLRAIGDRLYAQPPFPDPEGLPIVRGGLLLGRLRRDRFEPSHALALALSASDPQRALTFEPGDPELLAYLAGHPLERRGRDGWLPIMVSGFPLGWGRRARGIVKNHLPKGLRG